MLERYYAVSETMSPKELEEALEGWEDFTDEELAFDAFMNAMAVDWARRHEEECAASAAIFF